MKKLTAGKAEPKKRTVNPGKKQPPVTVMQGRDEKSKLSLPTKPARKDTRKYHGLKPGYVQVPKTISVQVRELRSQRIRDLKNKIFPLLDAETIRGLEGDPESFMLLMMVAVQAIHGGMQIQNKYPAMANDYAKTVDAWPILWFADDKLHKEVLANMKRVDLGAEIKTECGIHMLMPTAPLAHRIAACLYWIIVFLRKNTDTFVQMRKLEQSTKNQKAPTLDLMEWRSTYEIEANHSAELYRELTQIVGVSREIDKSVLTKLMVNAVKLPSLSEDTWEAWFNVAWEFFLYLTDEHPEDNERLKLIGASAKNNVSNTKGVMSSDSDTIRSHVRSEIKKTITRNFLRCCDFKIIKEPVRKKRSSGLRARKRRP